MVAIAAVLLRQPETTLDLALGNGIAFRGPLASASPRTGRSELRVRVVHAAGVLGQAAKEGLEGKRRLAGWAPTQWGVAAWLPA